MEEKEILPETCLEIDGEMIRRVQHFNKSEYNQDQTYDEARAELETMKAKGCLLYEDCRSCPKFYLHNDTCPI